MGFIKDLPPWAKGTLIIASLLTGAGIVYAVNKNAILSLSKNPGFNPNYWINSLKAGVSKTKFLSTIQTTTLARQINDSIGTFSDDEAKIIAVFRPIVNLIQLSEISWMYNETYKEDLFTTLYKNLSITEMKIIKKIVTKLPSQ